MTAHAVRNVRPRATWIKVVVLARLLSGEATERRLTTLTESGAFFRVRIEEIVLER
jgi:hypothetical protein